MGCDAMSSVIFCGLELSNRRKSYGVRPLTKFPLRSVTVTGTSTNLKTSRITLSFSFCSCFGGSWPARRPMAHRLATALRISIFKLDARFNPLVSHDARYGRVADRPHVESNLQLYLMNLPHRDRKSTRLNSSHRP